MGSGKAFGYKIEDYGFEETEFVQLLEKNDAVVAGSYTLSAYIEDNLMKSFDYNDLDIFINKIEKVKNLINFFEEKGYKKNNQEENDYYECQNIIEVLNYQRDNKKIQIIVISIPFLDHLKTFDLDCCKAYWCNQQKKIIAKKETLKMKTYINTKHLNPNTMKRCKKYINRGFHIYFHDRDITEACNLANFLFVDYKEFREFLNN